jgi:hypothetical protein
MKKLISNSNPFILLLIPVLFALIMGVGYQVHQHSAMITGRTEQATSLFYKSVGVIKTVCAVAKEKLW